MAKYKKLDNTLQVLKILEKYTNKYKPLSKDDIIDIVNEECFSTEHIILDERAFHRVYNRLIDNNYPIKKIKGKVSLYYYNHTNEIAQSVLCYLFADKNNKDIVLNSINNDLDKVNIVNLVE